ncbi:uncharacterized protein AC631_05685 [Debaryomyces fabryi]|uniref:TAFII28-like protein domain-containing protein n=1 Tax=Debaryomyces fabryi TaxID=58627 RepID=A0A0V1PQM9_9ASCO|nr:uncharacterized protein AC631_05685 [Debaryomyces fabryi]KRZ98552.1 hypothetical protein AC631_05685 [Debaryomyces fabryi]CUM56304.1 unnamed protein product [Debaryomyces fabryi]
MHTEYNEDEHLSDVSLDEEDEELIWKVFYSSLEKETRDSPDGENESELSENEEFDDLSDISDIDDPELISEYKELKSQTIGNLNEEEKKRLIIGNFTDDQMERFESYRRMTVNKPGVKKICNGVLGHSIPQNIAVVLAGLSKLFLGEIITRAFEIQEREHKAQLILDIDNKKKQKLDILKSLENGKEIEVDDRKLQYRGDTQRPLLPEHIREAWRLYKLENSGVFNAQWRAQGDSDGKLFR